MKAAMLVVLCSMSSVADVAAQSAFRVVARDSGAVMYEVARGAYAIIHADAIEDYDTGATEWPHGNTGVIVGDDAVLVIDSNFFPARATADIALIRAVTTKPVRYLVNTHWHGDHTHGNAEYRDAFPGLLIISAMRNRSFIEINQLRFPGSVIAAGSSVRTRLAALESLLANRVDSAGTALTSAQVQRLGTVVHQLRTQLDEFARIRAAPPTTLFSDSLIIDLGGRVVTLRDWGRANSPSDVTAYLPVERVLFTGDIVVHPVPYVFGAYPGPWLPVLRAIAEIPVTALVPGHGPVMTDQTYTAAMGDLFEDVASQVRALLVQGKTLAELYALIDLSHHRAKFVAPGDVGAATYWEASIEQGLVERTFQCITGSRC